MVKKQREEIKRPLGEKPEEFFSFIHSPDEKQEETKWEYQPNDTSDEMPDAIVLLDETIPDDETFQRHLQQISLINHNSEPAQLWECPYCGSLNPAGSESCDFCGGKPKQ